MTTGCVMLADDLEEILGPRLADWLRSYDYKTVAAMFPPTAPQTAKRWKAGSLPQVPHMAAMVERWGRPFVDHVFEPLLGDVPLERRAERIEADMRQLRKDLAHVDAATQRTLDLARAGDSVDGAGAGQRGLSPVAASGSDGRTRDQAAPARPDRLNGAARGLGVWLAGLALGLALADGGGWVPVPDDQAAQPIMQRAPRGGQQGRSLRLRQGREFDI